jgi:hypothetical protein
MVKTEWAAIPLLLLAGYSLFWFVGPESSFLKTLIIVVFGGACTSLLIWALFTAFQCWVVKALGLKRKGEDM